MHIDWVELLQQYGYIAIFIGAFFEGETVMMLGAYAVHQHWLQWLPLVLVGAGASFCGDQLYYQLGYHQGQRYLQHRPKLAQKFEQASGFIERYPTLTILLMRFAMGLRIILPISFGIRRYSTLRYVLTNIIACLIWSITITTLGIKISQWIHHYIGIIPMHDRIWAGLLFLSLVLILAHHFLVNRKDN